MLPRSVPCKPLWLVLTSARKLLCGRRRLAELALVPSCVPLFRAGCPPPPAPCHASAGVIRTISHGIWIEPSEQHGGKSSRDVSQPGRQAADGLHFQGASRCLPLTSQLLRISLPPHPSMRASLLFIQAGVPAHGWTFPATRLVLLRAGAADLLLAARAMVRWFPACPKQVLSQPQSGSRCLSPRPGYSCMCLPDFDGRPGFCSPLTPLVTKRPNTDSQQSEGLRMSEFIKADPSWTTLTRTSPPQLLKTPPFSSRCRDASISASR